jgi:hypothetical protein
MENILINTMELISSITYFSTKQPKRGHYMLKCVTWQPASQPAAPGPTPFPEFKKTYYCINKILVKYHTKCTVVCTLIADL